MTMMMMMMLMTSPAKLKQANEFFRVIDSGFYGNTHIFDITNTQFARACATGYNSTIHDMDPTQFIPQCVEYAIVVKDYTAAIKRTHDDHIAMVDKYTEMGDWVHFILLIIAIVALYVFVPSYLLYLLLHSIFSQLSVYA
jgi:hypothetical protein